MPVVAPRFPRFEAPSFVSPGIPLWAVTPLTNSSSIHRFFDSSPFSPSTKLLALTRFVREGSKLKYGDTAEIVVVDLFRGSEKVVAKTTAFDSQVGAHVQWGQTDDELYFNDLIVSKDGTVRPVGVRLNPRNGQRRTYECTIYAISPDGNYAASPNLMFMQFTQLGYGVHVPTKQVSERFLAPSNDGLYLTNLATGKCTRIISLKSIAQKLNLDPNSPTYGFHVKWKPDGQRIMFVIRQHVKTVNAKRARQNHVVTMSVNGTALMHTVTWASKVNGVRDGNHPNWTPSGKVSMNLLCRGDVANSLTPSSFLYKQRKAWSIVTLSEDGREEACVYTPGSGHPIALRQGNDRYFLTDVYAKEQPMFGSLLRSGWVPLRLIDTHTSEEAWLLQAPVTADAYSLNSKTKRNVVSKPNGGREWRCDMHPALDSTQQWVAINIRVGRNRQVLIGYLGAQVQRFFAK